MKKKIYLVFAFLYLLISPGVSIGLDRVDMIYDANAHDIPPEKVTTACGIQVDSIVDDRPNKETIGTGIKTILSGNPVPWIDYALNNLSAYGYSVRPASAGDTNGKAIVLSSKLYRAYVWHGPVRLNGMVAMEIDFAMSNGKKLTRKYRASGGKTNWFGSTSEYMTTLNYAMNNILAKLAKDLESICQRI